MGFRWFGLRFVPYGANRSQNSSIRSLEKAIFSSKINTRAKKLRSGLRGGSDAGAAWCALYGRRRGTPRLRLRYFLANFCYSARFGFNIFVNTESARKKQPKTILYDQNDYPYFIAGTFVLLLVGQRRRRPERRREQTRSRCRGSDAFAAEQDDSGKYLRVQHPVHQRSGMGQGGVHQPDCGTQSGQFPLSGRNCRQFLGLAYGLLQRDRKRGERDRPVAGRTASLQAGTR